MAAFSFDLHPASILVRERERKEEDKEEGEEEKIDEEQVMELIWM